ncbi:pentapeptide repeat-containing protein [Streptomyces sp. NPDC093546]|uniref:pentapeptide repeat-containing protein n=1 Tax=Streptomyces sp. NPDC093546 TaxID=3366040 RepID=UPI0037FAC6B3
MARKTDRSREPRLPDIRLPPLRPYADGALAADAGYDELQFEDLDLTGQNGRGARFLECALTRCALDETSLRRARFMECLLTGVRGVGADLAEASLRDVELTDVRFGGLQMHGATLERVVVRGGKIDYLNLRRARLKDVVFDGCVLVEPDFAGARLERVAFRDCALRGAEFSDARLTDVDLRAASELDIARGIDRLSGAVISPTQLLDLAPVFAAQLGVRVEAMPADRSREHGRSRPPR